MREKKWKLGGLVLGLLLVVSLLWLGCAGPISQKVVPLIPYQDERFAPGEERRSISLTKEGVTITVKFLEVEDLTKMAAVARPPNRLDFRPLMERKYINYASGDYDDMLLAYSIYSQTPWSLLYNELGRSPFFYGWSISPYLDDDGSAIFTAFSLTVENKRSDKIGLDPFVSLVRDDSGHQLNAYSYQQALSICLSGRSIYPIAVKEREWARYRLDHLYPPGGQPYLANPYAIGGDYIVKSRILLATLLQDRRVYPGAKVKGILVFPKLTEEEEKFHLIIPEVSFFEDNKLIKRVDFEFDFWVGRKE